MEYSAHRHAAEDDARLREVEEKIDAREATITELRRERNALLADARQRSQYGGGVGVGGYASAAKSVRGGFSTQPRRSEFSPSKPPSRRAAAAPPPTTSATTTTTTAKTTNKKQPRSLGSLLAAAAGDDDDDDAVVVRTSTGELPGISRADIEASPSWQLQRRLGELEARAAALLQEEEDAMLGSDDDDEEEEEEEGGGDDGGEFAFDEVGGTEEGVANVEGYAF